jgi:hypothetical protein
MFFIMKWQQIGSMNRVKGTQYKERQTSSLLIDIKYLPRKLFLSFVFLRIANASESSFLFSFILFDYRSVYNTKTFSFVNKHYFSSELLLQINSLNLFVKNE